MDECLFCRIAVGTVPAKVVFADEEFVAFEDIQPQAPVHLLLIPRRHLPGLNDLAPDDDALFGRLGLLARRLAHERGLAEAGYRIVVNSGPDAGQSVFHLHLHLLGGRPLGWPPG
ncbi:MAG: histidine triad nucleotide-binding protein [Candidatus Eisenbacteria bacterium]|nr:histidine triad nucleotide-binding protein [Candidatus Eisenbacteria bacterium]